MTPDQMTELAARLREHAELHRKHLPQDNEQQQWTADLDAAADLIERLTAEPLSKRYSHGRFGMRPDKDGDWCEYAPAVPQAEPKRDPFAPDELERIIDDYVADYELSDGEVSRDVSDEDRFMLKDAIMGLLVDPAWDRAWGALIDQRAREQAEPKREPLGGSNAE